ncbi:MAG: KdsC family phosphatase [Desulfococcaceae bacterium]
MKDSLANIRLLLLDVDGVLTDGSIMYQADGTEIKCFNAKDGLGIRLLMESGIQVGIVTGRSSPALIQRCRNLGISLIFDGVKDKGAVLEDIMSQTGVSAEETAFAGDDLPDIGLMRRVGFSAAVADAHEAVRQEAAMVTVREGGRGAVREICEAILKARGAWEKTVEGFRCVR